MVACAASQASLRNSDSGASKVVVVVVVVTMAIASVTMMVR